MGRIFFTLLLAVGAISSPTCRGPTVHIRNGTLVGSAHDHIDSFYGIPYVEPPIGDLRLRAPQPLNKSFGLLQLTNNLRDVAACVQMDQSQVLTEGLTTPVIDVLNGIGGNFTGKSGEDCLTINVQRPSGVPRHRKLPVLFWIYGGGWELGTTQLYDASAIVQKSEAMGEPVIFVAPNYRVNAYGFLNGKEIQEAGVSNLGLRDQRKALEWVAENIEAFGGDPDRVTIWGESAGAVSVFDHMIVNNGDHKYKGKPLFRGAIMNSGTFVNTLDTANPKPQRAFDTFARNAGCDPSKLREKTINCLRRVQPKTYQAAMNSLPNFSGPNSNDLAYIRRVDPSSSFLGNEPEDALRTGQFAHVPIITGNMQDEATIFAVSSRNLIHSTESLVSYFTSWFPDAPRGLISKFIATYPDKLSAGLPAGTGNKFEIYPQFKRNAAIQTDVTFEGGRRVVLQYLSKVVPTWSYIATFLHLDPQLAQVGTYHTSDLGTQFYLSNPTAGNNMNEAYIRFVNDLDPNGRSSENVWWPKWDQKTRQLANFSNTAVNLAKDDYRQESLAFLAKYGSQLRQ
ncbi:hypothetical protein QQS21_011141 [Conoideocrella luteorostrata]|uniref:Carboxylic ester hydrolase n=1 Tax=Conoideocrella luteorostrata TaxID=1105319 RepID=A0AAJ0FW59_9HYPO|nr:hypothetical protein QQS21_011141 [Conoideocrella luteorostrata]